MTELNITDIDLRGSTSVTSAAWAWAREAADTFGGKPKEYIRGALSEVQRESVSALGDIEGLKEEIRNYADTYTWKEEVPARYERMKDNDVSQAHSDAQEIISAIDRKMSEGSGRAMALRIMNAIANSAYQTLDNIRAEIDNMIEAAYEQGLRHGMQRTQRQIQMKVKLVKIIANA